MALKYMYLPKKVTLHVNQINFCCTDQEFQFPCSLVFVLFSLLLGVALTGTFSAVLAERKKPSTGTCGLCLFCEKKQETYMKFSLTIF